MDFESLIEIMNKNKLDESQYFITEKRGMWIVEDSKGRSAIGRTFEEAKQNFLEALNKEYEVLKDRVDREAAESKRKHRELWNY